MTTLRLKFVQAFYTSSGTYYYFRKRGSPRVRLPGLPGSSEFMAAYQQALAAAPVAIGASKRSRPGSVSAALAEYYGSHAFRSLTGGTPARRRSELERFREDYGQRLIASLPKEFIVALLDSMPPHAARNWLKTLRHFFAWAVERKLMRSDPTWRIRIKVPKSDGHHTWSEDELAAFEAHHPVGSKARLALALGLYTAQRTGDAIRMGRQHIRDGVLTVRQQKTGAVLAIPVHPELAAIIAATPRSSHPADDEDRQELQRERLRRAVPGVVQCRRTAAALRLSRTAQGGADAPRRGRLHRASDRSHQRPQDVEGSSALHHGGRAGQACARSDGAGGRQNRHKRPTSVAEMKQKGRLACPTRSSAS
jgi:integrase